MLFRWMPVPGTTTPLPEPSDADSDAALPCASTTEMCVVPDSIRFVTPPRCSARTNAPPRAASCASIASAIASGVGSASPSARRPSATSNPPARRRRVRAELVPAVLDGKRPAPHDAVALEILERQRAPARLHVLDDRARELAAVQRSRTLRRRSARASPRAPAPRTARPAASARPPYIASPSGECRSSPSRIRCRYPCVGVSSTPSRASRAAGATSSAHGTVPQRRCAASRPSAVPGTATAAAPVRKSCCVSPSKSTASSSSSPVACAAAGTETKKSSSRVFPSRASWTSMNPPPPGPVSGLSHTHDVNAAATHASTAFPPSRSTLAPAAAVSG